MVRSVGFVACDYLASALCGLTFDMRGGRKQAKLACGRPLDGMVDLSEQRMATGGLAHASVANGQPIRAALRRLD